MESHKSKGYHIVINKLSDLLLDTFSLKEVVIVLSWVCGMGGGKLGQCSQVENIRVVIFNGHRLCSVNDKGVRIDLGVCPGQHIFVRCWCYPSF